MSEELDILVAERVMGYTRTQNGWREPWWKADSREVEQVPPYSSSDEPIHGECWVLFGRINFLTGLEFTIQKISKDMYVCYAGVYFSTGSTIAEALCRASLNVALVNLVRIRATSGQFAGLIAIVSDYLLKNGTPFPPDTSWRSIEDGGRAVRSGADMSSLTDLFEKQAV